MKKVLEDHGLKVNNSMSKTLLKRLYSELEAYLYNEGELPQYCYDIVDKLEGQRDGDLNDDEARSEQVPFLLPTLDHKLKENINILNSQMPPKKSERTFQSLTKEKEE